jgi:hypothetical protein
MTEKRMARARNATRGAALPLLGAALLGAAAGLLAACSEDRRGGVDEAVEELRDEAMDAKDEIEDEIDDHT